MTDLHPSMQRYAIAGTAYGFSAVRVEDLGATEYTLVALAADCSGSVTGFADEIEACMAEVARSCLASPRADNLLIRVCTFDDTLHEVHGFRPLASSGAGDYTGSCRHGGTTALYDATLNAVASITDYAKTLDAADFEVNGILFVITDGGDNASQADLAKVADAFERARRSAGLDSLVSVLVGVGVADANLRTFLEDFRTRAGFTAYVELPRADAATLARLAHFVSKSVMRQSQVLGAGGLASLIGF